MIRQLIGRIADAAIARLDRVVAPPKATPPAAAMAPDPSAPQTTPAPQVMSKWSSPAFHIEALASAACPDCGEAKKVGWYRCSGCHVKATDSGSATKSATLDDKSGGGT